MTRTYATLAIATLAALGLAAAPHAAGAQAGVFDFTSSGARTNFSGSLGVQFTVSAAGPVTVSALGFYAPNVTQDAHSVGIFSDATQTLVGSSVTFAPGVQGANPSTAAGSFVYLSDTIVLLPGTYTLEANYPNNGASQTTNDTFDEVNAVTNNDPSVLTYNGGAYEYDYNHPNNFQGATLDYAPDGSGDAYFGPNMQLAAAPEPSQTAALGLGVLGLTGLALKARRKSSTV